MTLSDGTKYDNPRFKNGKDGSVRQHREMLNRQLSRRQGYSNIEFRKRLSELRKENVELKPSKRYIETKVKKAKLERKVTRRKKISYGEYGVRSYKKIRLYWNRNFVG